jgi:hypothetical protein
MGQALISRASWGARYPDGFRDRPLPIKEWWLHHSVTIAPDLLPPFTDDDAAVRTLENIGQQRFGGGISYTFPVTPVGRIYTGHSFHRQGAHTKGHNTVGAAFVLVGDYTKRAPTDAQRDRIAERMVIEHRAGRATRHTLNGGHRDASGNSTSCPGDAAHAAVPDINRRANALWAAGYPSTAPTPTPEDDMFTDDDRARLAQLLDRDDGSQLRKDMGYLRDQIRGDVAKLDASVTAQAAALEALAGAAGGDAAAITAVVDAAVRDRLERIALEVTDAPAAVAS